MLTHRMNDTLKDAHALSPSPKPHRISVGVDVVEYYSTHGRAARVKMFHLVHNANSPTDSPYDLLVVNKGQIRGDYFTMSAAGVVMVREGDLL